MSKRLSDRQLQALLNKTANLAAKHFEATQVLGEAFIQRYGIHYSEVDCDTVIDVCNYTGGSITVAECDQEMAEKGHPRLE